MHDIEDWSNDAENSAFHNMNYIKKKKLNRKCYIEL